ncbi:exosome complex exonuclease RRP42 [Tetranychus urticae]|uniref:Ribosomal RNA-processing protein 42 n=1 Tax=Tetranychus urticae TaxID=32264 RepID=T1KKL1_TETUR|nr:exosome complex exonuclease RRP42 [Tetranychus urticae]
MAELKLSEGEKCYLINGINDNFRIDGRSCWDRREIELENNLLPSCVGSALIRSVNCSVIAGVKMSLVSPDSGRPGKGKIEFFADISANADPLFEGRGGQEMTVELVRFFEDSFKDCSLLDCLTVVEGKQVWCLSIDILILEIGARASLYDLCSIAVKAALYDTRLPKVYFNPDIMDIEISEDPFDLMQLDVSKVPIFVTVTRIGNNYTIDPTQEEEASSIASLLFSVDNCGTLLHSKKLGHGSLHCYPIKELIPKISEVALELHNFIDDQCKSFTSR